MDKEIQKRLDGVLERVKVLEDSLPLSHTEVVSRFRYDGDQRTMTVYLDFSSFVSQCPSCLLISIDTKDKVERDLRVELEREFPGDRIVFA